MIKSRETGTVTPFYGSHKQIIDKVRWNFSPCRANSTVNILNDNKTIHKDTFCTQIVLELTLNTFLPLNFNYPVAHEYFAK